MAVDKCDHDEDLEALDENVMQCPKCKMKFSFQSVMMAEIGESEKALRESLMYLFAAPWMGMPNGVRVGYDSEEVKRGLW